MHFFRDFAVILHNILVVIGLLLFFFLLMNLFIPGFQSSNINIPLHPGGTATHKSLKSLAIVTAKSEADNRVNSTVCESHKEGDSTVYMKTTRGKNKTVWCTETVYYRVTD